MRTYGDSQLTNREKRMKDDIVASIESYERTGSISTQDEDEEISLRVGGVIFIRMLGGNFFVQAKMEESDIGLREYDLIHKDGHTSATVSYDLDTGEYLISTSEVPAYATTI